VEVFNKKIFRENILKISIATFLSFIIVFAVVLFRKDSFGIAIIVLILPFILVWVSYVFYKPVIGVITILFANYFIMGLARYVPGPLGLSVDGLLTLTWLAVIFSQFNKKVEWNKAWNGLTIAAIIWFAYSLFQLLNPEAVSRIAWFYAMRGVSLYMILTVPLIFIVFNAEKDLNLFIKLWAWFTLIGVAKGMMQLYIGPDPWEQHWLNTIGGKTHLLPGGLRVFSFFTDAATYGGSMGFSGMVFSIITLYTKATKSKIFFAIVALAAFFAMMISGTRGAMAVPLAGIALFSVVSKKFKILILGTIAIVALYAFLKFTTIGNSVYEIRRFRTALDPNNPSLLVRKENQELLKDYLSTRPFGGGIGSAGNWGLRFSPGTFLAETPTDSWYVQIWAEQGRVGLMLHLLILFYVIGKGAFIIMFQLKSEKNIGIAAALLSGIFGVMAASYGSGALGQMPNGIIIYISMAFIFMMPGWEKKLDTSLINP
jgi:hypothetical protein